MTPKTTDRQRKKIASIVIAVLVIVYVLPIFGMIVWGAVQLARGENFRLSFQLICWAVLGGAVIVGVLKALRERLKEIDSGEEEKASQY